MTRHLSTALLLCVCIVATPAIRAQQNDALQQRLEAGRTYIQRGDVRAAGVEYRAFLAEALHRAANARAMTGDLDGATKAFEESLGFAGNDTAIQLDYVSALLDLRRIDQAKQVAESVVAAEPANARAHALLGRALLDSKEYERAKEHLQTAANAGWNDAWRQLAIACFRLRQPEDARKALDHALATLGDTPQAHLESGLAYYYGDYPQEAAAEFKKVLAQDKSSVDAHYYLGLAYLGHNEEAGFEQAIPEFRAALKIVPTDARSHYMLGHIALKQRDFTTAERELLPLVAANPSDRRALLAVAELYQETARDAQAEATLRKIVSLSSGINDAISIRAHYMLGRLLQKIGRTEEGAAEIATSARLRQGKPDEQQEPVFVQPEQREKALAFLKQISPAIADVYSDLGTIAAQREDLDAAISYNIKSALWNPAIVVDRTIGLLEVKRGGFGEAVKRLQPYLAAHPADAEVRYSLAMSLFLQKNYADTVNTLRAVEAQVSGNPAIAMAYGYSLAQTGNPTRGIELLRNVVRAHPELGVAHVQLAEIYSMQGDHAAAADEYRKASRPADAERESKLAERSNAPKQ